MPELVRLGVLQQVGANYSSFGILLLNDKTGSRVDAIEDECRGKPERITRKILQEWMEGKGLPLTWESLIKTLRDTGLSTLADQIETSKVHARIHRPHPPPELTGEQPPQKKQRI